MAEHAATSTVEGPGGTAARAVSTAHESEHFSGRPVSWAGTTVVCAGFVAGGVAFFLQPVLWWLFWTGAGVAIVGLLIMLFAKTFSEDWY